MDAVNGKVVTGWDDPTFWITPDRRVGFSLALYKAPGDGNSVVRAATMYADAPNYSALKALLKMALEAVEREEKKIQKPNVPL